MTENKEKSILELAIEEAARKRGISVEEAKQIAINQANAQRIPGNISSKVDTDEAVQQIKDAHKKKKHR